MEAASIVTCSMQNACEKCICISVALAELSLSCIPYYGCIQEFAEAKRSYDEVDDEAFEV